MAEPVAARAKGGERSALEVLGAFFKLGCTSFGGPVAHLGYFRVELVARRRWLGEAEYADIVALCRFLPGPASTQAGMALGLLRAGLPGALLAWLGFTLPSALALTLFGYGLGAFGDLNGAAWLRGLKIVAVMGPEPHGWQGALLCLGAIFLPSFLLVTGALPFWSELRRRSGMQAALRGVDAAVVGLLLAALCQPVWTSAILAPRDFILGLVAFLLLAFWRVPPWLVVILGALGAEAVARLA